MEEAEPEVLLDDFTESTILKPKEYSDDRSKLRSLHQIINEIPEHNFYAHKPTLCIFRFEDVVFNIYPQMAAMKRKGQTAREIFFSLDVNTGKP